MAIFNATYGERVGEMEESAQAPRWRRQNAVDFDLNKLHVVLHISTYELRVNKYILLCIE